MQGSPAVPKMILVAAIVASIFAAAASPCTAGGDAGPNPNPKPPAAPALLVENQQLPASPVAQDFISTRCGESAEANDVQLCDELLLPFATSINGSYNRANIAGVTVMVSKLTALEGKAKGEECTQAVEQTISGAKEALAKLGRIDNTTVAAENPDLIAVKTWIRAVPKNFDKCPDLSSDSDMAVVKKCVSIAGGLIASSLSHSIPLPSPDGTDPFTN